jgi:hypothetical protein
MVIRRRVDNCLTCRKTPLWFARVQLTALPKVGEAAQIVRSKGDANQDCDQENWGRGMAGTSIRYSR